MTTELWAALSAVFLAIAVAAWLVKVLQIRGPWASVAVAVRVAAVLGLVIALGLSSIAQGEWPPWDRFQVTLGLTLAMLAVYLVLAWKLDPGAASPVVDLLGLALILVGVLPVQATEPVLGLLQRTTAYYIQWALFLLGSGAAIVAGCAALTLALHSALGGRVSVQRPGRRAKVQVLLKKATMLSVVALGSGLVVSVWWAWRTMGTLSSADPRGGWLTIGWLGAAMSLVAWRLERRWEQWAAGLAMAAALVILLGVLGPWA